MIVFSYYPSDPRVKREAEALAEDGYNVDVICLQNKEEKRIETKERIRIIRCAVNRSRKGFVSYLIEYILFALLATIHVTAGFCKKRYDAIHVHNMPDFLIFCGCIPKLFGCKLLLDLHDPMPEVFITKYDLSASALRIKILMVIERISIKFADKVVTPNVAFQERFTQRSCPAWKINIIMNSPQENVFFPRENRHRYPIHGRENQYIIMYHGTIVERHGLDDALKAIKIVSDIIPGLQFWVFGDGDSFVHTFNDMIHHFKMDTIVTYFGRVSNVEIADKISQIDLGLIPNKASLFTEINFPTRIFEYLAMDKICIVPETKGILDYFTRKDLYFFPPGNVNELASCITSAYENRETNNEILTRGKKVYSRHSWSIEKKKLIRLYSDLLCGKQCGSKT